MNLVKKVLAVGTFTILVTTGTVVAAPHSKKNALRSGADITVLADNSDAKKPFEIDGIRYTPKECAFALGELRTTRTANATVALIVRDDVELWTIADLSHMAVDAGFSHVQAFVYWPRSHSMAEIQFGPVLSAPRDLDRKR